jgi:hypothetical protein
VPIAAIKGSIAGLPLTPETDYLSFGSMRELAEGVASVIDNIERLNSLQQAAYEKYDKGIDWSDPRPNPLQRNTVGDRVGKQVQGQ